MQPFDSIERIEDAAVLDRAIQPVVDAVKRFVRPQALRDALHGVWLGHPLHPALVQVPVGSWASAAVLDLVPGLRRGADTLIGVGVVSAAPAALSGLVDWSEAHHPQRRVGVVHALANVAALGLYTSSLAARARGQGARGRLLGFAGLGAVTIGSVLGGHLAYRQATGANHAEEIPHVFPEGWQRLGGLAGLPDGTPTRRDVAGVPLVVLRRDRTVTVLGDRCAHASGPLSEGTLSEVDGETCLTCPWHGSTYRLRDGAVVHGPGTAPQPVLEVDIRADEVWVRVARTW